jgi:hypothetical protein
VTWSVVSDLLQRKLLKIPQKDTLSTVTSARNAAAASVATKMKSGRSRAGVQ